MEEEEKQEDISIEFLNIKRSGLNLEVCLSLLALLMSLSRPLFIRLWEARCGRDQGEERMKEGGLR